MSRVPRYANENSLLRRDRSPPTGLARRRGQLSRGLPTHTTLGPFKETLGSAPDSLSAAVNEGVLEGGEGGGRSYGVIQKFCSDRVI